MVCYEKVTEQLWCVYCILMFSWGMIITLNKCFTNQLCCLYRFVHIQMITKYVTEFIPISTVSNDVV